MLLVSVCQRPVQDGTLRGPRKVNACVSLFEYAMAVMVYWVCSVRSHACHYLYIVNLCHKSLKEMSCSWIHCDIFYGPCEVYFFFHAKCFSSLSLCDLKIYLVRPLFSKFQFSSFCSVARKLPRGAWSENTQDHPTWKPFTQLLHWNYVQWLDTAANLTEHATLKQNCHKATQLV